MWLVVFDAAGEFYWVVGVEEVVYSQREQGVFLDFLGDLRGYA